MITLKSTLNDDELEAKLDSLNLESSLEKTLDNLNNQLKESKLTETPDDDIMSDDELDAAEKAERDEMEARFKARRDKVAQDRADRDAKVTRNNELKAKAETLVNEIGDDWSFENLFDVLVPNSGKCDTLAGELVRAANKLEYRWYNDGDRFNEEDGIETCGPAAYFLAMFENGDDEPFWNIIDDVDRNGINEEYNRFIETIKDAVINYIKGHNELLAMETKDMLDTKEDVVRDWLNDRDLVITYEYELDMPDDLMAHLEKGNISDTDVEWEVEGYTSGTPYVYERDGYITFEEISSNERDDLERYGYKWLQQYADSLTDEFGDPYEEDSSEWAESIADELGQDVDMVQNVLDTHKFDSYDDALDYIKELIEEEAEENEEEGED